MSGQAPPVADLTLERQVLGEALTWGAFGWFVAAGLVETDFYRDAHRRVWRAADQVTSSGAPVDAVTVRAALQASGDLAEVGEAYLNHLEDGTVRPTWAHVEAVVGRLRVLAASRRVITQARQLEADAVEGLEAVPGHLSAITATVEASQPRTSTWDAAGQMASLVTDLTRDQAGRIFLGIPSLDNILGGLHVGEVLGLMARPGVGKTLLLGHMLAAVAEGPHGLVMFSLEMPVAQIAARLARTLYGLNTYQLEQAVRACTLDTLRYTELFQRCLVIDAPALSVAQMDHRIRQESMGRYCDTPIRVVVIDHLGMVGGDRRLSTYDRVSTQSREIKDLAKRHHVAIVLAIQVSREAGGADGAKELTLGSARDSGVVEEAMDYLVGMRRLDRATTLDEDARARYRDHLFLKVLKNRHGDLGSEFALRMDGHALALSEAPEVAVPRETLAAVAQIGRGRR